ncbi:sodium- and chloride-dependent glycine transporter 1-like isoform X2 [Dreissena polymorpha]|uniref:sodium- and chloride-dependent glycine transporter 1-like isoform X2 n=1 Tax=Dreissena polymorpha TaxID=45954 RepID=UPI002263E6BE|nr:sodium- and chloride-dependent glycine transporter 1-like isoform X2 [Dreissena polymorpha]
MDGGTKAHLVENEHLPDETAFSSSSRDDITLTNGDVSYADDNFIVSTVQPGIYSGFSSNYGTVSAEGPGDLREARRRGRGGVWTQKQVYGVDENTERGNWTGRFEYLLSMLGYAVGLGNVWRFPNLCYKYGGGAFLIPYVLFMTFVGIPLFYMESALGQFTSSGPTTCWQFAPLLQDCRDRLRDVTCDGIDDVRYDNGTCYLNDGNFTGIWNYTAFKNVTGRERIAPSREYWETYVLRKSDRIEDAERPQWRLVLCLLFSWSLVFLCLARGIKSAGKIVYFTAIFPYIILVILFFRGVTLKDAGKGIAFYITPEFKKLGDIAVWKAAAIQIFFSLGPCYGGIVALSSYNRFHNNIYRDALIVSLGNCLTSVFGGFVIFAFVGHMAGQLNVPVEHVADEGPGLAFVVYPDAVQSLPAPAFWSVIFFFMLVTLGIDTQFASVEALLTGLLDLFPGYRPHKTKAIFAICGGMFLLGLPFTTRSGIYWVTLVDYYGAAWSVLLTGLIEVIAISYCYGIRRFCADLETMIGPWRTWFWCICWTFITPAGTLFILLFAWIDYKPVTYASYHYPAWAETLGWFLSFTAISAVPLVAVYKVTTYRKDIPIIQRVKQLLVPARDWGPALVQHRQLIKHVPGFIVDPEDWNHGVSFTYQNISEEPTLIMHGLTETAVDA